MASANQSLGYQLVHGRLAYTHRGVLRGEERFTVSVHSDGSKVLRAMSEIFETRVLRDVSMRLGADGCPRDAFVRLTVDDQFRGSGWFVFDADRAEGETLQVPAGRISQRLWLDAPVRSFGTHPIAGDAWHAMLYDMAGPRQQHFDRLMISSYAFDGATGPELLPVSFGLEFIGPEEVTVPAGTFRCRHFRFLLVRTEFHDHPPYDIWVTEDPACVIVRAHVGEPRDLFYELMTCERIQR